MVCAGLIMNLLRVNPSVPSLVTVLLCSWIFCFEILDRIGLTTTLDKVINVIDAHELRCFHLLLPSGGLMELCCGKLPLLVSCAVSISSTIIVSLCLCRSCSLSLILSDEEQT